MNSEERAVLVVMRWAVTLRILLLEVLEGAMSAVMFCLSVVVVIPNSILRAGWRLRTNMQASVFAWKRSVGVLKKCLDENVSLKTELERMKREGQLEG